MNFHALRFDRAAATYGLHAQVQERMASALADLRPAEARSAASRHAHPAPIVTSILEMGCGTGNLTRHLRARFPGALLRATDAAPRMLASAQAYLQGTEPAGSAGKSASPPIPIEWALFDASGSGSENQSASPRFDLAASNALVQWFPDLRPHLALVHGLLAGNGVYLVSGFLRDNFPEMNAILKAPPFAYPDYPGHAEKDIRAAAEDCGFRVAVYREEEIPVIMPSARAFLDSIRGLGSARKPEAGRPLTRSRLALLLDTYQERYAAGGGVRATWKPWYAKLTKA